MRRQRTFLTGGNVELRFIKIWTVWELFSFIKSQVFTLIIFLLDMRLLAEPYFHFVVKNFSKLIFIIAMIFQNQFSGVRIFCKKESILRFKFKHSLQFLYLYLAVVLRVYLYHAFMVWWLKLNPNWLVWNFNFDCNFFLLECYNKSYYIFSACFGIVVVIFMNEQLTFY